MNKWSLAILLESLHNDIQQQLIVRKCMGHPGTKGDASEKVWLELLQTYLPKRYVAEKAHVVDSHGVFSEQIDVVIFDRQYSPFIFNYKHEIVIPAESVYAVFEAKQTINVDQVRYAKQKVASVRRLLRTSLPIPHAGVNMQRSRSFPFTEVYSHSRVTGTHLWRSLCWIRLSTENQQRILISDALQLTDISPRIRKPGTTT